MSLRTLDLLYDKISEAHEKIATLNLNYMFESSNSLLTYLIDKYVSGMITETEFIDEINFNFSERILPSILPRMREYAVFGVRFGSMQLHDVYRGRVNKSTTGLKSVESTKKVETLIIDWSLVEQNVVDYVGSTGIDRSWYSTFTAMTLDTNKSMIESELQAFIRGETTLVNLHDNLSILLHSEERAKRVIRTSLTDVFAAGQQAAYREAGTKKNRWYTKNDTRVCPYCQPLNGMTVDIGAAFDGNITRPPYHLNCRCYLSPVPLERDELFKEIDKLLPKRGLT